MKKLATLLLVLMAVFSLCATTAFAADDGKSKFYDFSDQLIDGEIKKPTALYTNARQKVKFNRLLSLKKSFLPMLLQSSKERIFK